MANVNEAYFPTTIDTPQTNKFKRDLLPNASTLVECVFVPGPAVKLSGTGPESKKDFII